MATRILKNIFLFLVLFVVPLPAEAIFNCNTTTSRPEWTTPVPQLSYSVQEGIPFELVLPWARDPNGGNITYSILNGPSLGEFDPITHVFRWIPGYSNTNGRRHQYGTPGDQILYFSAFDECQNERRIAVYFEIQNRMRPPLQVAKSFYVNGQPYFPVIAHGIPMYQAGVAMLPRMRALGMNTVITQGFGSSIDDGFPEGHPNRQTQIQTIITHLRDYLRTARSLGLMVIIMAHQPEIVAALKDDPALLAWKLPDEPDFWIFPTSDRYQVDYYSPQNFKAMRDSIREIDPLHPVIANFTARFAENARSWSSDTSAITQHYRDYFDAVDVISFDYYLENSVGNPSGSPQNPGRLAGMVEEARELSGDQKPIIAVLEATNYAVQQAASLQANPIMGAHVRSQISAVIQAGASAVSFYAANDYVDLDSQGIMRMLYHAWDIAPQLETEFPIILGTMLQGISQVDFIGIGSGGFPTTLSLAPKINPTHLASSQSFVWEVPTSDFNAASKIFENPTLNFSQDGDAIVRVVAVGENDQVSILNTKLVLSQVDYCKDDALKRVPGMCGCGLSEADANGNGTPDCVESQPQDRLPNDSLTLNSPEMSCKNKRIVLTFPKFGDSSYKLTAIQKKKRSQKSKVISIFKNSSILELKTLPKGQWTLSYQIASNGNVVTDLESETFSITVNPKYFRGRSSAQSIRCMRNRTPPRNAKR